MCIWSCIKAQGNVSVNLKAKHSVQFHLLTTRVMTFPTIQLKCQMSRDAKLAPVCQHLPGKLLCCQQICTAEAPECLLSAFSSDINKDLNLVALGTARTSLLLVFPTASVGTQSTLSLPVLCPAQLSTEVSCQATFWNQPLTFASNVT